MDLEKKQIYKWNACQVVHHYSMLQSLQKYVWPYEN